MSVVVVPSDIARRKRFLRRLQDSELKASPILDNISENSSKSKSLENKSLDSESLHSKFDE
eukprot:11628152-Ditylum_brightwellii.AAC.1